MKSGNHKKLLKINSKIDSKILKIYEFLSFNLLKIDVIRFITIFE